MTRHLLLLPLLALSTHGSAQSFNWAWSVHDTATLSTPDVQGFATDAMGNSFVVGQFYGAASFGGLMPVTSLGQSDVFVTKYDDQGVALWVASAGGTSFDIPTDLSLDPQGDVLITGYFQSPTITFGTVSHTRNGQMDIFVAKLSGVDGSFLWSRRYGSNDFQSGHVERANSIASDAQGNAYVTGGFRYTLAVEGLPTVEGCSQYYTSFLMKLDPAGNGVWSRRMDCTKHWSYGAVEGQVVHVGEDDMLYVGSRARGDTIFLETDTILNQQTSGQAHDGILAKYDLDGNYQWARGIGGYGYDDVQALAADADGNCYIAMHREGSYGYLGIIGIDWSGSLGYYKNVVLKYTTEGTPIWGVRLGNSTYDHDIEAMQLEGGGNSILVAGWHQGNFQFDDVVPNPGISGSYGLFMARYTNDGVLGDFHASRYQYPRGIRGLDLDGAGNIYIAGYFQDSLSFPGLPVMELASDGGSALFLARSGDVSTGVIGDEEDGIEAISIFPVPSSGPVTIRSTRTFNGIRVRNALGAIVMQRTGPDAAAVDVQLDGMGMFHVELLRGTERIGVGRVLLE